jgi:glycosyltransferase involved in cell wall biosynthesis
VASQLLEQDNVPSGQPFRIAATGFVSDQAGSVASANAVFLRELLRRGHHIDFFSKPSFVDPRTAFQGSPDSNRLRLIDCTNRWGDGLRRKLSGYRVRVANGLLNRIDVVSYYRGLSTAMRRYNKSDVDLWLGDWARGRGKRPVISFAQGPPGTDARSVFRHRELIERLAGRSTYLKLAVYSHWRLSVGLPDFRHSDHIILGSQWSLDHMANQYNVDRARLHAIPYPIDLNAFQPKPTPRPTHERLRLLWLGRFVPRKRLDLFLDALGLAIRQGIDVEAWVIGKSGFVPNYERLITEFPFADRLRYRAELPRQEVPHLMSEVDVLVQPSDEENFGSSVAESLACGVPAIVGKTNGTGDYLCERSVRLPDDDPQSLAAAISEFSHRKLKGLLMDRMPTRLVAERLFSPDLLTQRLWECLRLAIEGF